MDDIYLNFGLVDVGHKHKSLGEPKFTTFEFWRSRKTGKVSRESREVSVQDRDLDAWLQETTQELHGDTRSLVGRFVLHVIKTIGGTESSGQKSAGTEKGTNIDDAVVERIVNSFGLQTARRYIKSCHTGTAALPPSHGQGLTQRAYSLAYMPKLTAVWSHKRFAQPSTHDSITSGIFFVEGDGYIADLKLILQSAKWTYPVYQHAMFPAFVVCLSFLKQVGAVQEKIKASLRKIEGRTGYHSFERTDDRATTLEELGKLSEEANGHATKLASVTRKSKTTQCIVDFICSSIEEERQANQVTFNNGILDPAQAIIAQGNDLLMGYAKVVQQRLAMQDVDIEYILERVQIQIEALFHLVTQTDSRSNLQLAESTREISIYSYRDASSMKTLAIVTMLFLPGSFVSALFSTNCFDWDGLDLSSSDISVPITPQFNLYWAITIPLTLVTFLVYFMWLRFQKRARMEVLEASRVAREQAQARAEAAEKVQVDTGGGRIGRTFSRVATRASMLRQRSTQDSLA